MSTRRALAVLGVLASIGLAARQASAFSVSYDQETTVGREVYQSRVSMKDQLFRTEMTLDGQESIILRNAQGTYTVMPSEGMAMKVAMLRPGQGPVRGAENYTQYLAEREAEKIGSETIDGRACDVYRYVEPETGETASVWVWKEHMFPVRFETDTAEGQSVTELSNIRLGAAISDEAFELPAGVQVMDLGAFMGMGQ